MTRHMLRSILTLLFIAVLSSLADNNMSRLILSIGEAGQEVRFSLPQDETDGQWLTTTAIYARIHQVAGSALKNGNIQKFGRVLANIEELSTRRSKRGTEYFVKPRQDD